MDTDESRVIPELDDHDKAALFAVLIRTVRAQDQIARDQALITEANARIVENNVAKARANNLLAFYGFKVPEGENVWNLVLEALGKELYDRAFDIARGRIPTLLEGTASKSNDSQETVSDKVDRAAHQTPVRTAILQYLRTMGDEGAKVGEVRRHLIDAYGMSDLHEKTPGMTLYRLLKDGLARREGRTWYISETARKENDEASSGNAASASVEKMKTGADQE